MKLLRVDIQDGDSQYSEYCKVKNLEEANDLVANWTDGFMRLVRNKEVMDMTDKELKILEKFNII